MRASVQSQDHGKDFVVHLDEIPGLFGDVRVGSHHGCHSVALIQRLFMGHHMLSHQPDVALGLRQIDHLVTNDRKVFGGGHGGHSWESLSFAGIDGPYIGVGVGAAQNLTVQHTRQLDIRPIFGGSGNLF